MWLICFLFGCQFLFRADQRLCTGGSRQISGWEGGLTLAPIGSKECLRTQQGSNAVPSKNAADCVLTPSRAITMVTHNASKLHLY